MMTPRGPFEGTSMVAPMVRVSTLGFRLMCSREFAKGHHRALSNSSCRDTANTGTAFFTEEIIAMKLLKAKREVREYHVPLNVPTASGDPQEPAVSSLLVPPGYLVPWAWAVQELLPPPQGSSVIDWPGIPHLSLVYEEGQDAIGSAATCQTQERFDADRDLYSLPILPEEGGVETDMEKWRGVFERTKEEDMEYVASRLLQARHQLMAAPTPEISLSSLPGTRLDLVRELCNTVAAAVSRTLDVVPPEGTKVEEPPAEVAATIVGGFVLLEDVAAIFRDLCATRTSRLEKGGASRSEINALATTPLVDAVLFPIQVVEFATYDNFKNVVKRTPALQVLRKTILNPYPEGDYRPLTDRAAALVSAFGLRREFVGVKRARGDGDGDEDKVGKHTGDGCGVVGRVICQLGAPNALFAAKAAAIVCDDVDGLDLNSGCPKGFSADNNMGAALMTWPILTGRILRGLHEGANGEAFVARRKLDVEYLQRLGSLVCRDVPESAAIPRRSSEGEVGGDWFHARFGGHCPVSLKTRLFGSVEESERHLTLAVAAAQSLISGDAPPPAQNGFEAADCARQPLPVPHAISLHCRLRDQRSDTAPLVDLGASIVNRLRSVAAVAAWVPTTTASSSEGQPPSGEDTAHTAPHIVNGGGKRPSKKEMKQQRKGGPALDLASLTREDATGMLATQYRTSGGGLPSSSTAAEAGTSFVPLDFRSISFVFNGSVVGKESSGPKPFHGTLVGRSCMWDPSVMGGPPQRDEPRTSFNTFLSNYDEILTTVGIPPPTPIGVHPSRPLNYLHAYARDLKKRVAFVDEAGPAHRSSPYASKSELSDMDALSAHLKSADDDTTALSKVARYVLCTLRHLGDMYCGLALFYGAYRTQPAFFKYHYTRSFGEFPASKVSIRELLELQLACLQLEGKALGEGGRQLMEKSITDARVPVNSKGGDGGDAALVRTLSEALQYAKGPAGLYRAVESCLRLALKGDHNHDPQPTALPLSVRYLLEGEFREEVVA